MKFDVNGLAASDKGACCLRTTASSTAEGFWRAQANCKWSANVAAAPRARWAALRASKHMEHAQ
jgi:hypothetical protein